MKKKSIISLLSVFIIVIAMVGTSAYFSKNFSSDNNTAKAADFDVEVVNSEGKAIGNAQFSLGDKLYPGMEPVEVYSFQIKKNHTELPLEYKVNLIPSGDLFPQDNSSPVKVTMQRNIDNQWVNVDYSTTFKPENAVESYKILVQWPHGDHDIDFQGKTGNIKLDVTATQVDGNSLGAAQKMYQDASNALTALDNVGTGFDKGNFSKAQSNAVQASIDSLLEYMKGVPNGKGKTDLMSDINKLQSALDAKVASRYVYYEIDKKYTNFTQLGLKLTADQSGQVIRYEEARSMMVSAQYVGSDKIYSMEYHPASKKDATVGDKFKYGMRFNGNVKTIDVTFTNLGGGNWKIESDWLVEKK
ncbi:hypothetical protein [Bacillus sp. FJAT-49736]|uniref:hypothetical protein n=1 Tax=Bacillus sp. FJAT-49736 TaxID=2833582 RepID=UPI001BC9C736|nr:hypothetical protein [Bacillus sp. FJAT-49736]MBS4171684.1 hypothetical protein [Bacillus sp. FJAT-49736]